MKKTEQISIEELISTETKNRLEEMEQSEYEFPKRITKGDVIAMLACAFGSLVLIALCMMGVIK